MTPPVHNPPPSTHRVSPTLEQMLENEDKLSPEEIKQRNAWFAKEITHVKKRTKMVNGMIEIRPGESGIVVGQFDELWYGCDPLGPDLVLIGYTWVVGMGSHPIASTNEPVYGVGPGDWTVVSSDIVGTHSPYCNEYGSGEMQFPINALIHVPVETPSGTYNIGFDLWENEEHTSGWPGYVIGYFIVPGPLTGNVSVAEVDGLKACVDLKADASTEQKVTSAEIDWGDGNTTSVSPAPDTQHYFGHECHTYASADTYTITVTYKDDVSPQNSIDPGTTVTVNCIDSANMSIILSGSSNGKDPTNGVYTRCYSATVAHSVVSGESYSYAWTFPDNTTVNNGGGANDKTASFCIATTDISTPSNIGIVSCKITKTTPTPSCDVTVSAQVAGPGGPPNPSPPGPSPGDPPSGPGNPPC